jgi:hypothetical protein
MRRFDISILLYCEDNDYVPGLASAVGIWYSQLAAFPVLEYHKVRLGVCRSSPQGFRRILESCDLARNVRCVIVERVRPAYAQHLRAKMTGKAPVVYLPQTFTELYLLAHSYGSFVGSLNAERLMTESDVVASKHAKAEVIPRLASKLPQSV